MPITVRRNAYGRQLGKALELMRILAIWAKHPSHLFVHLILSKLEAVLRF